MHRAMHHDDDLAGFRATATGEAGTLETDPLRRHVQNHTRLILGLLALQADRLGDHLARYHPGLGLDVTADTVAVATSDAVTLGLIVNELVADGAEQALTEGQSGIRIELRATGAGEARLTVIANGRGLAEARRRGSGLEVAEALAAYLGAELAIISSPRREMQAMVCSPSTHRDAFRPADGTLSCSPPPLITLCAHLAGMAGKGPPLSKGGAHALRRARMPRPG
jgi:hypothetical protein